MLEYSLTLSHKIERVKLETVRTIETLNETDQLNVLYFLNEINKKAKKLGN